MLIRRSSNPRDAMKPVEWLTAEAAGAAGTGAGYCHQDVTRAMSAFPASAFSRCRCRIPPPRAQADLEFHLLRVADGSYHLVYCLVIVVAVMFSLYPCSG